MIEQLFTCSQFRDVDFRRICEYEYRNKDKQGREAKFEKG